MVRQNDTLTFRATIESWLGRFILPFLFLGLAVVTIVNMTGIHPVLAGLGLLLLLTAGVYHFALPMLLNWLQLDLQGLAGQMNGNRFHILWTEVLAAWMIQRGRHPFLCLGTSQGTAMIPLRFFDAQAVWKEVRSHVSSEALDATAFKRLPDYREWSAIRDRVIAEAIPRQVFDHWIIQLAGWGSLVFFIANGITAWSTQQRAITLTFIPPSLLSILMISNWGITEFDQEGIKRRTMTGAWAIRWEELEQVEIDPFDARMVFEGAGKRVAVSGPMLWVRVGREDALTLIQAQAEIHHVPLRRSVRALLKLSRNSRVHPQ